MYIVVRCLHRGLGQMLFRYPMLVRRTQLFRQVPDLCLYDIGFLARRGLSEFSQRQANALQIFRNMGEPRRLHAVVGADPEHLWRRRRVLWL